MEKIILPYGSGSIEYLLWRKNVKNINLNVKNTGEVIVSANASVPQDVLDKFVLKKSRWIIRNQRYFEKSNNVCVDNREYVSGENYVFMGNQYRLKVEVRDIEGIEIIDGYIFLFIKNKNALQKKRLMMTKWYKDQTKAKLTEFFLETCTKYKNIFADDYELQIRLMKSRWGSCNSKSSKITLNSNLIYAPKYCIEYVVLHELCHFKYQDHSKAYYELLENLMPDWKIRKQVLDEEVVKNILGVAND